MTAVATATSSVDRLYPVNGVPSDPQYPYGVFSAVLGRGDTYSLDGLEGVRWGRIVVQTFGRAATSALEHGEEARAALAGAVLDVDGYETTAVRAELDPQIVRDPNTQGVVSVTATYTFTATEE